MTLPPKCRYGTALRVEHGLEPGEAGPGRGGGWVAEETLAVAVYCALRYSDDFFKGVIAAVNHSGDSDSTGAVTGNILGAWLGCGAIEDKWKQNLELRSIIPGMADDLCYGCPLEAYHEDRDPR